MKDIQEVIEVIGDYVKTTEDFDSFDIMGWHGDSVKLWINRIDQTHDRQWVMMDGLPEDFKKHFERIERK